MAQRPTNPLLLLVAVLVSFVLMGAGPCGGSEAIAASAQDASSSTDSGVTQQSGTMYSDQTWDILITTGISGGTYTFSFLPEFVTADDQSGTNGIVHADPKGATGIYPFVVEVSNGTDSEMIRYTLTIISK